MQETRLKMLDFPIGVDRLRNVLIHIDAEEELISLYERSLAPAHQARLAALLNQRFRFLSEHLAQENVQKEWFEILKNVNNPSMRSMKLKVSPPIGNLRLIYVIVDKHAVILCAFIDRRTSDYRHAIEIARKRYEDTFE